MLPSQALSVAQPGSKPGASPFCMGPEPIQLQGAWKSCSFDCYQSLAAKCLDPCGVDTQELDCMAPGVELP